MFITFSWQRGLGGPADLRLGPYREIMCAGTSVYGDDLFLGAVSPDGMFLINDDRSPVLYSTFDTFTITLE